MSTVFQRERSASNEPTGIKKGQDLSFEVRHNFTAAVFPISFELVLQYKAERC